MGGGVEDATQRLVELWDKVIYARVGVSGLARHWLSCEKK